MPDIGGWEWVILAVVALVLFGGSKIGDLGKNLGTAVREFKEETAQGSSPSAAPAVAENAAEPPVAAEHPTAVLDPAAEPTSPR